MIIHLTPENLRAELIDASFSKPILAYFFADALPECQTVTNQLSTLVGDNNNYLTAGFIDMADPQLQGVAMQLGLQALPAVVIFKDGRPVDALMGPQQMEGLANLINKYLPKEEDILLSKAQEEIEQSNFQLAYQNAHQAFNIDSTRSDIKLTLAQMCLELKKLQQASDLLATIPMVDQNGQYQMLSAALELAQQAAESPELKALEQKLAANPANDGLKEELAIQYNQAGRKEDALELLLTILTKNIDSGCAKKIYLDILATMPSDGVTAKYRRYIYSLLY